MALNDDIVAFLKSDSNIRAVNFSLRGYRVWPAMYQIDVAEAIRKSEIKIRISTALAEDVAANYMEGFDLLNLRTGFSAENVSDRAFVVHEATHAHFDMRKIGEYSRWEAEALAYLAEALYLESSHAPPLGPQPLRAAAHRVAGLVLGGAYEVPAADATALVGEVAKDPHYSKQSLKCNSDGLEHSWFKSVFR